MKVSAEHWIRIKELSAAIANATVAEAGTAERRLRKKLLKWLDELEEIYGEAPEILATRADYSADVGQRKRLYTQAYASALRSNDTVNLTLIGLSIAEDCAESLDDVREARLWLRRCKKHLNAWGSDIEERELQRIEAIVKSKE
jgi:hypothetical protein